MGHSRFVRTGAAAVWTGERSHAPDDELVAAACAGDREAFTVIYHRYKLDVWRLAWYTLHDHHEAEDVLQETWVKAHRSLARCRRGDDLRPWLLTICRNACRDRLRASRRRETVPLLDDVVALPGADPERDVDLQRALHALPVEEREAFLLVDVLGCRSEEAARIAGLPASSTLRSRLGRARKALVAAVGEPADAPAAGGDVWALRQTPHDSVLVTATGGGPGPRLHADAVPDERGLLDFLDGVDRAIPLTCRVLAVVVARPASAAAVAAPWLASHPRWSIRRAPDHASWVSEVDALLRSRPACTAAERDALRERLAAGSPLSWTGP